MIERDDLQMAREIAGIVRDAILAERERCIKIAQSFGTKAVTRDIVAAIRRG